LIGVYWDTSALLKTYVHEPDSEYFLNLIATSDHLICSSVITTVEFRSSLSRKAQAHEIRQIDARHAIDRFAKDCNEGRIVQLSCGVDVTAHASQLIDRLAPQGIMIRSLDALHIATAVIAKATGIVTTDHRMRDAASGLNLKLLPMKQPAGTS
jgi:predicted nucleic acid-binding protein